MKRTELLAPAGDYASLIAAFNAGADAVYLAGKQFGARAYAGNFEEDELLQALDYAHLHGKKIYLTLNTLIKESEFSSIREYLIPYYKNGLDGIIIQDLGLIPFLKKEFPGLELHASTQMTVNNYRSAKWLKEQGLCRVVPSRELSLTELQEIKENDFNLNITRYVNLSKEEEQIDLKTVTQRLNECDTKITEAQNKLNGFLKELGLDLLK